MMAEAKCGSSDVRGKSGGQRKSFWNPLFELRSIRSIPDRNKDLQKNRQEAIDFYNELEKTGGVYTMQVKCGKKQDEFVTEISNSDCLWKTQRKMRHVQMNFEEDGIILRLTCGCIVPHSKDMDCFPFTIPNAYRLYKRPFVEFCDSEGCLNRAVISKEMNLVVTCEHAQLVTTFWHSMEKKIKYQMRLKGPRVVANMCLLHFKDNYKIDCPRCAHMFVYEFRDEVKKKLPEISRLAL